MRNSKPSPGIRSILRSDVMRALVAVAELGSVRAAAEALALSPSAVSKQIRRLEEQVGQPLFIRSRDGVTSTLEGEDLTKIARRFLSLVDEVGSRFDRELMAGRVRLGITEDVGLTRVPGVLRTFATRYPAIEVALEVGYNSDLLRAVGDQRLDLVLVSDGGDTIPAHARNLRSEPLVWVGHAQPGGLDQAIPLAVSTDGCQWRSRAVAALNAAGIAFQISCESPATAGQVAAVKAGLAVAPLPRSIVEEFAKDEPVRADLPPLGDARIALVSAGKDGPALNALADALAVAYGPAEELPDAA